MSDKRKNSRYITEIGLYLNNKMEDNERYDFECMLQKDPFLEEAIEGMSKYKTSEIEKDINNIDLIKGKTKTNPKLLLWIFILVGITVLVFFAFNFKIAQRLTLKPINKERIEDKLIFNRNFVRKDSISDSVKIENKDSLKNSIEIDRSKIILTEASLKNTLQKNMTVSPNKNSTVKPLKDNSKTLRQVASGNNVNNENVTIKKELPDSVVVGNSGLNIVSDNVINNEADNPENPKNAVVKKRIGVNAKPEPIGGNALFKTFIDNNIKYPSGIDDQTRETVRLKFTISTTGEVKNFEQIKGPENNVFIDEAIRTIKGGPKWSPAIKDGIPVEEEVTFKIIFKPEK